MFQAVFSCLFKYIRFEYSSLPNTDNDPTGIDYIGKLPNEILTKILDYLCTNEKLRAALVCKKWKSQVDENVTFDVRLNDQNFNQVGRVYQTRRVKTLHINNYSNYTIPIEELCHLKTLHVGENVNKPAIRVLLTNAINLNSLVVNVSRHPENGWITEIKKEEVLALVNLKSLQIECDCDLYLLKHFRRPWNMILDAHMPNIEFLYIILHDPFPFNQILAFDFFRLTISKPKLRRFVLLPFLRRYVTYDYRENLEVRNQPLTPAPCEEFKALSSLIQVNGVVREIDEHLWKVFLSGLQRLESLNLACEWFFSKNTPGFSLSIIHPVLMQSRDSLHTLALTIDTQKNGNALDMEVFSQMRSLRELKLEVWKKCKKDYARKRLSTKPQIINCDTVIQPKLKRLCISGFKVGENDANKVINKIAKLDLVKVKIYQENQSTWNNFEQQVREMGPDKDVHVISSSSGSNTNGRECSWHHVRFEFVPRSAPKFV